MRDVMPTVAGWMDAFRAAFGKEEVDGWIRQGLRDGTFRAQENGHVIGGIPSASRLRTDNQERS